MPSDVCFIYLSRDELEAIESAVFNEIGEVLAERKEAQESGEGTTTFNAQSKTLYRVMHKIKMVKEKRGWQAP